MPGPAYFADMNQQFVDLHVHTTASDGNDSPAQVVQAARASIGSYLAIKTVEIFDDEIEEFLEWGIY